MKIASRKGKEREESKLRVKIKTSFKDDKIS